MTATQWALIYLAAGAALIAASWHASEKLMLRELDMTRTALTRHFGRRPATVFTAVAMLIALLFSAALWPLEFVVAGALLLKRR